MRFAPTRRRANPRGVQQGVSDGRYSFFNAGHLFIVQQREWHMLDLLRRHGFAQLENTRLFEIGCGTGYGIRQFIQ